MKPDAVEIASRKCDFFFVTGANKRTVRQWVSPWTPAIYQVRQNRFPDPTLRKSEHHTHDRKIYSLP